MTADTKELIKAILFLVGVALVILGIGVGIGYNIAPSTEQVSSAERKRDEAIQSEEDAQRFLGAEIREARTYIPLCNRRIDALEDSILHLMRINEILETSLRVKP